METKQEYIRRIYLSARLANLCGKQKDFADKVGVSRSAMSAALNGVEAYLSDNLVAKVRLFAKDNGLEETKAAQDQSAARPAQGTGVFIPEETRAMFDNMAETIRIQAQMLAQFQGGALFGAAAFAPKNYRTDGK